jgi:peptidyl-prolyl cis-trans isomerase D
MPGDVSPVVRTPYGYHVLKLLEVKRSESLPFETVKDKIHQELVQKESDKRYKDYMRKLRASAYIEVKI